MNQGDIFFLIENYEINGYRFLCEHDKNNNYIFAVNNLTDKPVRFNKDFLLKNIFTDYESANKKNKEKLENLIKFIKESE